MREVVLVLQGGRGYTRGYVEHVAASNAYVLMWDGTGTTHVPCARVAAVRRPHFHEQAWGSPVPRPSQHAALQLPYVHPNQMQLAGLDK